MISSKISLLNTLNDKYGILNEYGNTIGKIEYDKIGYKPTSNVVKSALVVDKLTEDNLTGIVVCKQEKYGIINMETGEMIAECELDKIYSKDTDIGEEKYYIELKQNEIELDRYIEYINTIRVDN